MDLCILIYDKDFALCRESALKGDGIVAQRTNRQVKSKSSGWWIRITSEVNIFYCCIEIENDPTCII